MAQWTKNPPAMRETQEKKQVPSLDQEYPLEEGMSTERVTESETTERLSTAQYLLYVVCMHASLLQSCLTLYDPMDCSPPGSSVHGILHARILEWVAILFSRGSSRPRDWTWVFCIAGRFFTIWTTREAQGGEISCSITSVVWKGYICGLVYEINSNWESGNIAICPR